MPYERLGTNVEAIWQPSRVTDDLMFFRHESFEARLTSRPSTHGHSILTWDPPGSDLFSLDGVFYGTIMHHASLIARTLSKFYRADRCALVSEGRSSLAIIPVHDKEAQQDNAWLTNEFFVFYPGFVSSKSGPLMNNNTLSDHTSLLRQVSGLREPFNNHLCDMPRSLVSIDFENFDSQIAGHLPNRRFWEDEDHVAFLSATPNTLGYTFVVPRMHGTSDVFSLDLIRYNKLLLAARTVAHILQRGFGVRRCGLILDVLELNQAHVALVPISDIENIPVRPDGRDPRECDFNETYPRYVTSQHGPNIENVQRLKHRARCLETLMRYPYMIGPQ